MLMLTHLFNYLHGQIYLLNIIYANIAGLTGKPKDEVVAALAACKVSLIDFLDLLKCDELKALCPPIRPR